MAREILKNAEIKSNYGVRADRTKARRDQLQALWVSADKFKRNGVNKKLKFINGIPKIVDCDCDVDNKHVSTFCVFSAIF